MFLSVTLIKVLSYPSVIGRLSDVTEKMKSFIMIVYIYLNHSISLSLKVKIPEISKLQSWISS